MTYDFMTHTGTAPTIKSPPSTVLSFAAPIEAGKTTVSTRVAERLSAPYVSFGKYLRRIATEMGREITRENLQDLGDQLIQENVRSFCEHVLNECPWTPDRPLIIDGVRHIEVLDALGEILAPADDLLIYIKIDRTTQETRLKQDDLRHQKSLLELERHPTESQVRSRLPDRASLVLDGTRLPEELVQEVIDFFDSHDGEKRRLGWDEKNERRIALAKKKSRDELEGPEIAEFDQLQTEYFDYLDAKYPRSPVNLEQLDEIEARLRALEDK
jgi:adenylate kinase family enzyme